MALPLGLDLSQTQIKWKAILDPVVANPANGSSILKNVELIAGNNVINHKLGKVMQGWSIVDQQASSSIYRPSTSPFNNLTLTLNSSEEVTVNLAVF